MNITVFSNEQFKIRSAIINGEPWFVGKDIAEALGYTNSRKALADHVDNEDKGVTKCDTSGGKQNLTVINESGVYSLVFGSKLESAKDFKRWVTSDVLPAIRKHGGYLTPQKIEEALLNPDTIIQLATQLKQEREKVALMEPKAEFYDAVANSESLLNMGDVAKLLAKKNLGRNNLYKGLRRLNIVNGDNIPYQRYVDAGYFKLIESKFKAGENTVVATTTYVTQRGVDYIRKLIKEGKL